MKNKPWQPTKHHVIPRSREKEQGSLGTQKVIRNLHEKYHTLFENLIPEEIVEFLNKTFWNNSYEITIKRKT